MNDLFRKLLKHPLGMSALFPPFASILFPALLLVSRAKPSDVEQALAQLPTAKGAATQGQQSDFGPETAKVISDRMHQHFLRNSLAEASTSVCILSGWLSDRVIDKDFRELLRDALMRGVDIFIGYGWESGGKHNARRASKVAFSVLRTLESDSTRNRYCGRLVVGKYPNHVKMLIVDCSILAIGSHNWLSNSQFRNRESSIVLDSPSIASIQCSQVKQIIRDNAVIP